MKFKIFGHIVIIVVTIEKNSFNQDDPEMWPSRHQKAVLKICERDCSPSKIPYIKMVRSYAGEHFGEKCGLRNAKHFIDKRYPELPTTLNY